MIDLYHSHKKPKDKLKGRKNQVVSLRPKANLLTGRIGIASLPFPIRLPRWCCGKEPACQCKRRSRCRFKSWLRKILWRRKWQPTPVFLPGKFHGQMSLAGYGPKAQKESDTTEHTHMHLLITLPTCLHLPWSLVAL